MGFLDLIKNKMRIQNRANNEEFSSYFLNVKTNLTIALGFVSKFLDATKNFQPAIRHQELYYNEVRQKLISMRLGLRNGLVFISERLGNEINTQNPIKSPSQLKSQVDEWIRTLNSNDDKVYDVIKILSVEMWSDEKAKRGFSIPANKELLCNYLTKAFNHLGLVSNDLDVYISLTTAVPNVS